MNDPERWDRDTVSEFIIEKLQLLEDKADIELLQITGNTIEVVVYVSEPDKPPYTVETYAFFWMMTNDITHENGLFVDTIRVTECTVEHSLYSVVGHYKNGSAEPDENGCVEFCNPFTAILFGSV